MATHKIGNIDADPEQNDWIRVLISRKRGKKYVPDVPVDEQEDLPVDKPE